jgi:uncharacterized coiled-coil DUF342 family protein
MDNKAIREELKEVQEKIRALKSEFSTRRNVKEDFFSQGEKYSEQINALYEEVKSIEKEHNLDEINKELDAKKEKYDELKAQLEESEKKFQALKDKERSLEKPAIKTVSAEKAKKELAKLELALQTQVLSLEKESEILKKISSLKESLGHSSGGSSDEFKKARKEFFSLKKKFVNIEKRIRSLYKQIRLISKEKKKRYKQIDELRELRKQAFEKFKSEKKEYSTLGEELKSLFSREVELLEQLGEKPAKKQKRKSSNSMSSQEIKKKQKEVEEAFLKGGKLTTEDLLMFQKK